MVLCKINIINNQKTVIKHKVHSMEFVPTSKQYVPTHLR